MKKRLLLIIALATMGTMAYGVQPGLGAPGTTGGTGEKSNTEVRVTANVVNGVAVNEAAPIDFGNLAKGMHTGQVKEMTKGRISLKGKASGNVTLALDKVSGVALNWTGNNGSDGTGTKTDITGITITGAQTTQVVTLDAAGNASLPLGATFTAGANAGDNLGTDQKLGSYEGTITVSAVVNP